MKRRMQRSIAKVSATSIDGYFGEGTPCFFIRGTILSDQPIEGEYRRLIFTREGNQITLEAFDGFWATVTIRTREGNRPGDNVVARLFLADIDLRQFGMDCAKMIVERGGPPVTFDVAALTINPAYDVGLSVVPDLEPESAPKPEPVVQAVAAPVFGQYAALAEYRAAMLQAQRAARPAEPPPDAGPQIEESVDVWESNVAFEPEPESEPVAELAAGAEPIVEEPAVSEVLVAEFVAQPEVERELTSALGAEPSQKVLVDVAKFFEGLRGGRSSNPALEIGIGVAAAAVPALIYMWFEFLKKNKPPESDA